MARYIQYKNGIFGHRYRGYYIIRPKERDVKAFCVMDRDKNIIKDNLLDYDDCEWEIDKLTASPLRKAGMKKLYSEEIYRLNRYFAFLDDKRSEGTITPKESVTLYWVSKIRDRKCKNRAY